MTKSCALLKASVFFLSICWLGAFSSIAFALNESPQSFTLDGQLFQRGTSLPLLDGAAKIKVQIISPDGTCLLYEEQQTVNTLTAEGRFTLHVGSAVGSAKRTVNDPGRTISQVFQNISAIAANSVPGQNCTGGSYTPSPAEVRYFRLTVTPSVTNVSDVLSPDLVIDSVPQALVAQSLQGLERTGVLQVNNSGATALTQANLEAAFSTPAYGNLQSILAGNFIKTDSSGATLPSYASNPAGASNGDIWFDSTTSQIKYQTSGGVQTVGAGGSGISSLTVSSSMSVNGTIAGTISSSGTIDLANTGVSSGTYAKVTVDTKGRVTAGTVSLVEADIPNLTAAGKVSGDTITAGTISGSTNISSSGNIMTTGTVSGGTVQATNLRVYNGTNYLQFVAPTLAGIVNFTLPDNDGNSGDVLTSNGSGVLSWAPIGSLGTALLISGNSMGADISVGTNDNKALNFKTNNSIAMTISQGGFVGIGTSTPGVPLEVSNATYGTMRVTSSVTSNTAFEIKNSSSGKTWSLLTSGSTGVFPVGSFHIYDGSPRLSITTTGNVGIGTTSPQTLLQVAGVISPATNNTYTLGNATYRFTEVYATNGVINTSDRREKKDIRNSDLGLQFINDLRPVSYRWNTGVDSDIHYGLIAQEAEWVLAKSGKTEKTSIVTYDESSDRYGVRYSELISPLIRAVQELYHKVVDVQDLQSIQDHELAAVRAENKVQSQEIAELKLKIQETEKANAAIKAYLCSKDASNVFCR